MARGRPRKSEGEHKLKGTYEPHRHEQLGKAPQDTGKPTRPRGLSKDERYMWDLATKDRPWIVKADEPQLIELCTFWGLLVSAMKDAKQLPGDRDCRMNVIAYAQQFDKLAGRFGLNPSDRAALRVEAEQKVEEEDPQAKYLKMFTG